MKLRVLGCSGGIAGKARTTSFLLDHDILIDAGTGVEDLSVQEMAAIDHVFLTHSHLDHVASLPLMIDSVGGLRDKPLRVHALPWTIEALRQHIFNWVIWPDFTEIPHYERPWMMFEPINVGQEVVLDPAGSQTGFRVVRALAASHTVPALGFELRSPEGSLVFSGDTGPNEDFWRQVNGIKQLRHLIIESAFPNRDQDLAMTAKHLFPIQLANELTKLQVEPRVYVTHLKPSDVTTTAREIKAWVAHPQPSLLEQGQVLEF